MRFEIAFVLVLAVIGAIESQAIEAPKKDGNTGRLFFSTFTVILSTVTTTTTGTTVTTCTTSAAALTTCSVGRRRRGLLYDEDENQGRSRRGLFYNDDEIEQNDGSISSLNNLSKRSALLPKEDISVSLDNTKEIPLVVQSGFSLPEGFPAGTPRFKLAYGTLTTTVSATSTSTRSLTATCASTTNYALCGSG